MDCMPGYTKFDRTKKVMAMIQIVGDENIASDTEAKSTEPCTELKPEIKSVIPGAAGAEVVKDGDTVKLADLGSALKATLDRSNIEFRGRLNSIANWEAYGPAESRTGHYFPFQLEVDADSVVLDTEVGKPGFSETDGSIIVKAADGKAQCVVAVDSENPIVGIVLKKGTDESHYTLDFSHVTFR